ncbi:MAG TPA: DUF3014 domain-containing protein, partial [Thermoanaerobaculia bacterium]|nr:DUF3014 domain-containing protein [Thermoanaerobaculia bacterium]
PALELPSLDASDELVRGLVAALSARPELGRWLVGEGLVRRLVAAVDNVAEGTHPRKHLPPLRPDGAFAVAGSGPAPVPATAAYGRYDGWVALFTSVEPAGTARLYAQLRPLIDEAYRDLGYPGKRFDDTLVRAFRNLLATPVPESPPLLTRKVTTWEYADPRLEALSPAQKQLLRLGPDNQRRVQGHLRALASALGIPQGRLPPAATYRR